MREELTKDGKGVKCYFGDKVSCMRPKIGGHMHEVLPVGVLGEFVVDRKIATEEDVKSMKLRSAMSFSYGEYYDFEPGTYTRLLQGNNTVMSDTPMEIRTNDDFVFAAKGKVLIGGLGLGVVLLKIQDKVEVESIVVVEKYKDVIQLVGAKLPLNSKVTIVEGDIFEWLPEKGVIFDTIYFDIWTNMCADNYLEMKELHKRFRKYFLKDKERRWMSSWRYDWAQQEHYEDNKCERMRGMYR